MARKKRKSRLPMNAPLSRSDSPRAPDWLVVSLAVLGMLITAYLTVVAWSGADLALCAEGSGCDLVQQSHWSTLLGLPVAFWGFITYGLLAGIAYLSPPRLKRWRRLWVITFFALAFSAYLTAVGWVSLNAVCAWCLASLATLTATFLYLTLKAPDSAPGMPWFRWMLSSTAVAVVLVGALHAYYSDLFSPPEDPRLAPLAEHLSEIGARYYGAHWCPACQQQNRMFRNAAEQLPYVECSPEGRHGAIAQACRTAGITTYPTWIIRGRTMEGVMAPEDLARHAGFHWRTDP